MTGNTFRLLLQEHEATYLRAIAGDHCDHLVLWLEHKMDAFLDSPEVMLAETRRLMSEWDAGTGAHA